MPYPEPDLDRVFDYVRPDEPTTAKIVTLRGETKRLAKLFVEICPHNAERSTAIRQLDEAFRNALASLVRDTPQEHK